MKLFFFFLMKVACYRFIQTAVKLGYRVKQPGFERKEKQKQQKKTKATKTKTKTESISDNVRTKEFCRTGKLTTVIRWSKISTQKFYSSSPSKLPTITK